MTQIAPLPFRPRPLPGESATSWLVRTARGNALSLHALLTLALRRRHQRSTVDTDFSLPDDAVSGLSRMTGVSLPEIAGLMLTPWFSRLMSFESNGRHRRWVMTRAAIAGRPKRAWTQYCVECLQTDPTPYFRKAWRLAFLTTCPVHGTPLRDTGPHCEEFPDFPRYAFHHQRLDTTGPLSICSACGHDLREAPSDVRSSRRQRHFERALLRGVERGFGIVRGMGRVHIQRILDVAFLLVGRLNRSPELRRLFFDCTGREFAGVKNGGRSASFDEWPWASRHHAMEALAMLFDRWPRAFVARCERLRVWSYPLTAEARDVPFWFASIVDHHLCRRWYSPSLEESRTVDYKMAEYGEPVIFYNRRRWLGLYFERAPYMMRIVDKLDARPAGFADSHPLSQPEVTRQTALDQAVTGDKFHRSREQSSHVFGPKHRCWRIFSAPRHADG